MKDQLWMSVLMYGGLVLLIVYELAKPYIM